MEKIRIILRWLAALFFIAGGTMHFVKPDAYARIMPPYLPAPALLVAISGVAEIAGGLGLLLPWTRRAAGWGLILLLIAVFPANLQMLRHPELFHLPVWLLWVRLPFQLVFMAWVWFVALSPVRREPVAARPLP